MIRIVIADDHQVVIDGLKSLLLLEESFEVVGEALDGKSLLNVLKKTEADVILLDINMPGMDGIETTRVLHEKHSNLKILILTMYNKPEFIRTVVEAGASGYILKNIGKEELVSAIQKVYNGEEYFSKSVTKTIMESFKSGAGSAHVQVTKREREILKLIVDGLTTSEIAEKLFVSTYTVDTHRKNLLSKLNIKNTAGLVRYAVENGYTKVKY